MKPFLKRLPRLNCYSLGIVRVSLLSFLFLSLTGCLENFELDTALEDFDQFYYGESMAVMADEPSAVSPVKNFCTEVDAGAKMSREQLNRLIYIAPGNSGGAMRDFLGLPYCWSGDTEFYPLASDLSTWIGVRYYEGRYVDYIFSMENY